MLEQDKLPSSGHVCSEPTEGQKSMGLKALSEVEGL